MNELALIFKNDVAYADSRDIAAYFGKRHRDVLRDIRNMLKALGEGERNFAHSYINAQGKEQPCYQLDFDTTITLVTGYDVKYIFLDGNSRNFAPDNIERVPLKLMGIFNIMGGTAEECCCEIKQQIMQSEYNSAMRDASTNANITAQIQSVKDMLSQNKIEALQSQVNNLQLQNALAGVVRYPNGMTYTAGTSPFCNCNGYFAA